MRVIMFLLLITLFSCKDNRVDVFIEKHGHKFLIPRNPIELRELCEAGKYEEVLVKVDSINDVDYYFKGYCLFKLKEYHAAYDALSKVTNANLLYYQAVMMRMLIDMMYSRNDEWVRGMMHMVTENKISLGLLMKEELDGLY